MTKEKTEKKTLGKGIKILIGIGAAVLLLFIVASLLISPPAKNLGVKWTQADAESAGVKLNRERVELPTTDLPSASVKFEGSHPVDQSFTSEELSAVVNTRDYKYSPAKNVQIRINEDGTGEMSGKIILANVIPFGEAFNIRNQEAKEAIQDFAEDLPINPTFYVKGTPKIVNGQAQFVGEEIKVGAFDLTDTIKNSQVNDIVNQNIRGVPGLEVESLSIENGELDFTGSYPDKSMYTPK